jgi:hypothetical protein
MEVQTSAARKPGKGYKDQVCNTLCVIHNSYHAILIFRKNT